MNLFLGKSPQIAMFYCKDANWGQNNVKHTKRVKFKVTQVVISTKQPIKIKLLQNKLDIKCFYMCK